VVSVACVSADLAANDKHGRLSLVGYTLADAAEGADPVEPAAADYEQVGALGCRRERGNGGRAHDFGVRDDFLAGIGLIEWIFAGDSLKEPASTTRGCGYAAVRCNRGRPSLVLTIISTPHATILVCQELLTAAMSGNPDGV